LLIFGFSLVGLVIFPLLASILLGGTTGQAIVKGLLFFVPFVIVVVGLAFFIVDRKILAPLENFFVETCRLVNLGKTGNGIDFHEDGGMMESPGSDNQFPNQISEILKQRVNELTRRKEQIDAVHETGKLSLTKREMGEFFEGVSHIIVEKMGYASATISLLERSGNGVRLNTYVPVEEGGYEIRSENVHVDSHTLAGWVIKHNQTRVVLDHDEAPLFTKETLQADIHSECVVPISVDSLVLGVLDVQSHMPDGFDAGDISVLQSIANHTASVIQRLRIEEGSPVNYEEVSLLYSTSRKIAQAVTEEQIYQTIGNTLRQIPYASAIFSVEETGLQAISMSYPQDISSALTIERLLVPTKQLEEFFRPEAPLLVSDFSQEHRIPYALIRLLTSWKCVVAAFIPVITREGPAALMMLAAQDRNSLTPAIVQPYASMAELIGTALEKVIALQSMEKRLNELQMINEVSQTISIQTDLDVLYEAIHRATTQIMGEVSFLIALYDPAGDRIQIPYMVEESRRMSVDPFPLGEGLTSILIKTSRPLMLVEDTENRARALGAKVLGAPAKSWLGVPLLVGGEVIGAIVVQDIEHEHRFTEDDLRLLTTFASQVAIAIRNARLLESSQRVAEHEHLLSEISSKVRASPDISMVLRTAILELSKAVHASNGLIRLEVGQDDQPRTNGNHGNEKEM